MRAFYFGTYRQAGHYLYDIGLSKTYMGTHGANPWEPLPWKSIDGTLNPRIEREGEALLHRKDGWTAIAFANRTDDKRGGSNAAFFFDRDIKTVEQAVELAKERFPQVIEKFNFEIVNAPEDNRETRRG